MLLEALEWLFAPCPGWSRRLGYPHQAVALRARRRRWERVWRPHLEACQTLIRDAMALCPQRRRAVVLGSGLLMEIPVHDLAAGFDEVVLVDAVHLLPERWRIRRWPNVRMRTLDVMGVAAALLSRDMPTPSGLPPDLVQSGFDFAVSANLLSQLPFLPLWFLGKRRPPPDEADMTAFAQALIRCHLEDLHHLAPVRCLIADTQSLICDGEHTVDCDDLLYGVALPPPQREWFWDIAPRPEQYRQYDVRHHINGYLNFN